jgi:hypothetical protein
VIVPPAVSSQNENLEASESLDNTGFRAVYHCENMLIEVALLRFFETLFSGAA